MNIGLNTNPEAVAADLELIQDLGITHIKYGFKADVGDEDQLLREAELLTDQGFQLVIDLREVSGEMAGLARKLSDNPSSLLLEEKETGVEIAP